VVVLPTPPFWFAQAIILAKCFPRRKLSKGSAHLQVVSRGTEHLERKSLESQSFPHIVALQRFLLNQLSAPRLLREPMSPNSCST
jgi:hypothetical protein